MVNDILGGGGDLLSHIFVYHNYLKTNFIYNGHWDTHIKDKGMHKQSSENFAKSMFKLGC